MRYVLQVKYCPPPSSLLLVLSIDSFGHVHLCLGTSCVQNAALKENQQNRGRERERGRNTTTTRTRRTLDQKIQIPKFRFNKTLHTATTLERERGREGGGRGCRGQRTDELRAGQRSDHRVWSQGKHLKT